MIYLTVKNIKDFFKSEYGGAVVEAALVIPVFLFTMIAFYSMCRCKLAEGALYEASCETAEYMSEFAYVSEPDFVLAEAVLPQYMDDRELVEKGITDINCFGTTGVDEDDYITLVVNYKLKIELPYVPKLAKEKQLIIRKRAYIGEGKENGKTEAEEKERYVYVTDNRDVYHESRMCTHLKLSISKSTKEIAKKNGYTPCEFCKDNGGSQVYITEEGKRYHSDINCSGLKRTVYRIKLSDAGGLPGCQRCTD